MGPASQMDGIMARLWFARMRCSFCNSRIGNDGIPVYLGRCEAEEVSYCYPCAIRLMDMLQAWFAMNRGA